jgi:hypothetical protein
MWPSPLKYHSILTKELKHSGFVFVFNFLHVLQSTKGVHALYVKLGEKNQVVTCICKAFTFFIFNSQNHLLISVLYLKWIIGKHLQF